MSRTQPDWQALNAYVDGELSRDEAAAVARALADDRTLANQVAGLTRLKAAVQESAEGADLSLPAAPRRKWRPLALAASLVLAVMAGLAAAYLPRPDAQGPAWVAEARGAHEAWIVQPGAPAPPVDSGVVLAALGDQSGGLLKAYLPDLTSARLTLSHLETVSLSRGFGAALHAGYLGTRGCKVSLLIVADGARLPKDFTRRDEGALRTYAWRAGPQGYLMVAEGMDEARLRLIAETVHRATLENSPFDDETRIALRRSRKTSAPCLA